MKFKEFLLNENEENYFVIQVGDILTSLQTIYEDSGVMSRKDIDNYLKNVIDGEKGLRTLLKRTKVDYYYKKILQKVATNIMRYLDPQVANANINPRDLIYGCIKELENLLSGKKSVINSFYKKNDKNLPPPEEKSINQELKSSNIKTAMPPNPGMETGVDNDKSPPLSGDAQRTLNVL